MTSSTHPSRSRSQALAWGALLAALALGGCNQKPLCSELGTCGGQLIGEFVLAPGHGSCSEDLYTPPPDTRLVKGDQPAARTLPPEVAFYDWCDLLVTNGGKNVKTHEAAWAYEPGAIGAAWVRYDGVQPVGRYAAGVTRTGTYVVEFPALCMRQFGAMDGRPAVPPATPDEQPGPPVDVCTQLQAQTKATTAHRNIRCAPNPNDTLGCVCAFDVYDTHAGSGKYYLKGSTIVHVVDTKLPDMAPKVDFPYEATYCNKGSSLELTGANGQYLFNESGLRTLDLVPQQINCADGAKGPGEEGVDCGAACGTACTF